MPQNNLWGIPDFGVTTAMLVRQVTIKHLAECNVPISVTSNQMKLVIVQTGNVCRFQVTFLK